MAIKRELTIDDLGVRMTDEHAALAHDKYRDAFSKDQRVKAHRSLERQHREAKKAIHAGQFRPPSDFFIYLLAGDPGDHKTHIFAYIMSLLYAYGMDVITNASLTFGVRGDPVHIYTFAEHLPENAGVGVDEAHNVVSMYRENSDRNVHFNSGLALIRKLNCKVLLASAFDRRISRSAKDMCKSVLIPWEAPLPDGGKYPRFSYVWDNVITPYPFSERGVREDYGIPRRLGKAKPRTRGMFPPRRMWQAAKVMDTFETPSLAFSIEASASKIRDALSGGPKTEPDDDDPPPNDEAERQEEVLMAYGRALAYASRGGVPFLSRAATHVSSVLQSSYGLDKYSREEIVSELNIAGLINTRGRVNHAAAENIWPESRLGFRAHQKGPQVSYGSVCVSPPNEFTFVTI